MSQLCDGQEFKRLIGAATAWLEHHAAAVNALNVFPVPDGDTGTNMLLTARAAYEEVAANGSRHAGEVAQKVYRGAQFGSRGNSGVILSQLLRGYASALKDKAEFRGRDLAEALRQAADFAYQGVTKPVEGTILTVAREAGEAALLTDEDADPLAVMEVALDAANKAVEKTPTLLKVLRDAGVVDAGGKGYYFFLEGMTRYLRGETAYTVPGVTVDEIAAAPAFTMDFSEGEDALGDYGYCTEFIVEGALNFDEFRADMLRLGDSAVVVGDNELIKVHIHTPDPGAALTYATQHGSLVKVKIENMDLQNREFRARGGVRASPPPAGVGKTGQPSVPTVESLHNFAVVAVAPGEGFQHIFKSMGASQIIAGGQTMNPSVQELLKAIDSVEARDVVILPNNKNVILTAQQVPDLTSKNVHVIASRTIPQGISAMLAIRHDVDLETNIGSMTEAIGAVQTVELARAVRSVRIEEIDVKEGQILGILNDDVTAAGDDEVTVAMEVFDQLGIEDFEVLSVYYGSDVSLDQARQFAEAVGAELKTAYDLPVAIFLPEEQRSRTALPFGTLRVELHSGDQPHYFYIMSVE